MCIRDRSSDSTRAHGKESSTTTVFQRPLTTNCTPYTPTSAPSVRMCPRMPRAPALLAGSVTELAPEKQAETAARK
eukprot:3169073-Rhodomonas_salina.1